MCAVVQRGTAAASGGREVNACGKTGTAQNPHGDDHGWFIGYAPADHPRIVVGSIMEFKLHGSTVAPYVVRVMQRYLSQQDSTLKQAKIKVQLLDDSVSGPGMVVPPDTTAR
jgi:penicillin-binding protein 2